MLKVLQDKENEKTKGEGKGTIKRTKFIEKAAKRTEK